MLWLYRYFVSNRLNETATAHEQLHQFSTAKCFYSKTINSYEAENRSPRRHLNPRLSVLLKLVTSVWLGRMAKGVSEIQGPDSI